MNAFVGNLLLALAWMALWGSFSPWTFVFGFGLSYLALRWLQPLVGPSAYFGKFFEAAGFMLFFIWDVVLSSIRVAHDIVTPRHRMRPGVIAVPLEPAGEAEITMLANLISLTPGTLSLDVADDRRTLFIHAMYVGDIETLRGRVKGEYERRVLRVLR